MEPRRFENRNKSKKIVFACGYFVLLLLSISLFHYSFIQSVSFGVPSKCIIEWDEETCLHHCCQICQTFQGIAPNISITKQWCTKPGSCENDPIAFRLRSQESNCKVNPSIPKLATAGMWISFLLMFLFFACSLWNLLE